MLYHEDRLVASFMMNPCGSGNAPSTHPAEPEQSEKTRLILMRASWAQEHARAAHQQVQLQLAHHQQHAHQQSVPSPSPLYDYDYQSQPPSQANWNMQSFLADPFSQESFQTIPVASMLTESDLFTQPETFNQGSNWSSLENASNTTPQYRKETIHQSQEPSNEYQGSEWTWLCDKLHAESTPYPLEKTTHQQAFRTFRTVTTPCPVVSAPPSEAPMEDDSNFYPSPVSPFLLHQACMLYAQTKTVIQSALLGDPSGIRRPLPPGEGYSYPINIALQHNASVEVLQLLCDADPSILVERDGGCCSLTIALQEKYDMNVVSLILHANPDVVRVSDRRNNYPLHTAAVYGSSLHIIKLLCSTYPNAIRKNNFHGQTPLDIASRSSICSDEVIDFLQHAAFGELEECALHLDSL
jgi:hypothetical protein